MNQCSNNFLFLTCILIISSCNNFSSNKNELNTNFGENISIANDTITKYYSNGNIQSSLIYQNDLLDGLSEWYYPNGNLKIVNEYNKGVLNGDSKSYYINSNLKTKTIYKKGKVIDDILFFDSLGRLEQAQEQVDIWIENGFLNTFKNYDSLGNLVKRESHFYDILNSKDIYREKEQVNLEICLTAPFFKDKMNIIVAKMDSLYRILDTSTITRYDTDSFVCKIPINTKTIGLHTMRFIINDYKILNEGIEETKAIYVKYEYEVKSYVSSTLHSTHSAIKPSQH